VREERSRVPTRRAEVVAALFALRSAHELAHARSPRHGRCGGAHPSRPSGRVSRSRTFTADPGARDLSQGAARLAANV